MFECLCLCSLYFYVFVRSRVWSFGTFFLTFCVSLITGNRTASVLRPSNGCLKPNELVCPAILGATETQDHPESALERKKYIDRKRVQQQRCCSRFPASVRACVCVCAVVVVRTFHQQTLPLSGRKHSCCDCACVFQASLH